MIYREESKMNREETWELLCEYTKSESLRWHARCVEAAMRAMAEKMGGDADRWGVCGLIHDFDYEKYPTLEDHPFRGVEILREKGLDEDFLNAVLGHGDHTNTPRTTDMAKAIYAVDELCGFMVAISLVRPGQTLEGLVFKSVKKKFKDKAFARSVNRDDIAKGAEELGMDLPEVVDIVRDALIPVVTEMNA
jgi:putative nucleotidyltransferase with HDIG domain